MRLSTLAGLLALVAVLAAPSAAAHVGAVHVEGSQPQSGTDVPCFPTCTVQTTTFANVPAVTVIESGDNVTWEVLEGRYHTATSDVPSEDKKQLVVEGQSTLRDSCMNVLIFDFQPVQTQFRINESQLEVLHLAEKDPSWRVCPEAIELPDGSFVLSYHCNNHPRFQQAAIHVLPK